MTKKELEAKVRELEARIALLEAQKPKQVMVPVPYYPQPYWVPTDPSFSQYCLPLSKGNIPCGAGAVAAEGPLWVTAPAVNLTCGAGVVAAEGALNTKTYTFG